VMGVFPFNGLSGKFSVIFWDSRVIRGIILNRHGGDHDQIALKKVGSDWPLFEYHLRVLNSDISSVPESVGTKLSISQFSPKCRWRWRNRGNSETSLCMTTSIRLATTVNRSCSYASLTLFQSWHWIRSYHIEKARIISQNSEERSTPPLQTDEFTSIQKVNISEEIRWFTPSVNSSVLSVGRVSVRLPFA
jgi:hypothetical protein